MKKSSVLLIGEHALLRAFVHVWLSRFKNLVVLAESDKAQQTMAQVARHKPDLVLMDFETLQSVSLDILDKLRTKFPSAKVIVYFAYSHNHVATRVIRAGASGYVVKSAGLAEMETAIRTVLGGGTYLSPEFLKFVGSADGLTDTQGKVLSVRQTEILKLVAQGLSTKSIAFELKISGKTVDLHKKTLVSRLGLKRNSELFEYAVATGLVLTRHFA